MRSASRLRVIPTLIEAISSEIENLAINIRHCERRSRAAIQSIAYNGPGLLRRSAPRKDEGKQKARPNQAWPERP
jgi:hypothetical protein